MAHAEGELCAPCCSPACPFDGWGWWQTSTLGASRHGVGVHVANPLGELLEGRRVEESLSASFDDLEGTAPAEAKTYGRRGTEARRGYTQTL